MSDPTRYLEDPSASPALKELLGSARDDGPSAADLARLAGKLGPLLVATAPVGAAAATSGAAGHAAATTAAATKVAGTAVVATGTGVLKVAVLAAVGGTVIAAGAFQAGRTYENKVQAERPAPVAVAPAPPPAPVTAPVAPEVELEPEDPPELATPEPVKKPLVHRAAPAPAPTAAPAPKLTEVELLEQAMAAMKAGDAGGALALTERHAREFASGALVQEREMLSIEALVKLGRKGDARVRAGAFKAKYPTSSHLLRLDALVGR